MSPETNPKHDRLDEPVVILFEHSPFGTLDAILQHDGKTVYFYLNEPQSDGSNSFGTRACWVRNLDIGPMVVNQDEMKQGVSPMLPRTHCHNREPQPIPDSDHLRVVWFEEGNGAALVETRPDSAGSPAADSISKTLAVIPPWSGLEGFHGYAAECAVENPLCWPMPDNPKLHQRIERATQFWDQWKQPEDPFANLQPQILKAYDQSFEGILNGGETKESPETETQPERKYFSIDGGKFPPRGLVQFQTRTPDQQSTGNDELADCHAGESEYVLATVGMSVCPQPAVEIFADDPTNYRRIELAIRITEHNLKSTDVDGNEISVESIAQRLSGLARYPWTNFTWLGPGHTCGFIGAPGCQSALIVNDRQLAEFDVNHFAPVEFPTFRDDPINLLWLFPITPEQQQQLQNDELSIENFLASNRL